MSRSSFDLLNRFIRRRYRWVIVAWIVAVVVSLVVIPSFFSAVSYNLISGFGAPPNTEAEKAASIMQAQFPSADNDSSGNSILVIVQGASVYSDALRQSVLALNHSISQNSEIANYTGESSLYSLEASLLNSSLPNIINQTVNLQSNILQTSSAICSLQDNLYSLSTSLFQLQDGLNQTAQLVYGIPSAFVNAWQQVIMQGADPYTANAEANATLYKIISNFGSDPQSASYYGAFYNVWTYSFQALPNDTQVFNREAFTINESVSEMLNSNQLDNQTSQMISTVASGLNVTDWNQPEALSNLAISVTTANIPTGLSVSLSTSPVNIVNELYSFGPSPSNATLGNYAITLLDPKYSDVPSGDMSFSTYEMMQSVYALGSSPNSNQTWNLACRLVSNATRSAFVGSPLFTINSDSLSNLLVGLSPNSTSEDITHAINNEIATKSCNYYPYIPTAALAGNFVNSQNDSMLIILGFSSVPTKETINNLQVDVRNSTLNNFGSVYVTGGPVLAQDMETAFLPALEMTVGPGIAISLLIVGLLFLAPVAALIPVLLGGVSVSVALASIYTAVVKVGHGNLTFLTPTLTILLMLGLAVDYSVLQLRRTREERQQGKSVEQSVETSLEWAGQAVLTAGITVIVAYIVMAVTNVPIFSDVGVAIALGVSILLLASLTLLPALEIAIGDRMFWPGLKRFGKAKGNPKRSLLKRMAHGTLKRKIPVVIIISVIAFGAFAVIYKTPTSEEFLKLIPNFPSNQGLTAISDSFGSGIMEPTQIIITTATPITYGINQFNQTLMNQIEQITAAAAGSAGVVAVSGPTRPYGSVFNYSALDNMSQPLAMQYESQIFSTIGENNKTAVVTVSLADSASSPQAINSLRGIEEKVSQLPAIDGVTVHYGGTTQSTYDSQTFMENIIPEVVLILAAAVYVILFFQLRSAFTPVRLIITILCSVAFSLTIISAIFYFTLNLPILDFVPLFVVVTMLGVGIDYDIFFITRIREEVLSGKSDNDAIVTAIDKVWVTILSLGLVLATVFGSLLITNIAVLQEISLAVAAAILIDITVVILFFVPALMGLAQKFNWWPYKLSRNGKPKTNTITEE